METLVQTQVVSHLTIRNVENWKYFKCFLLHRVLPGESDTALLEVGEPMFDGQVNIIQAHLKEFSY